MGKNHFFALSSFPLAVGGLQTEYNKITYSSNTVHHGIEVLWPGPAIIVRYAEQAEKVADPVFSPEDGFIFENPFYPAISTETEGAYMYYTTDGSDPNPSDNRFRGSLLVNGDMIIKVRAFKSDYFESNVVAAHYNQLTTLTGTYENSDISIYPNPAKNYLLLELPGNLENGNYQILNSNGVVVKTGQAKRKAISLNDLTNGLYIFVYNAGNENFTGKFLVQR